MKNIIFLISLPRSGSTLLQRILMTHPDIASIAEPWLLLPFCYAFKKEGCLTEYSHKTAYTAFEDFIKNLPSREEDYYISLRNFAENLYKKYCLNGEKYFLDKTPRYYLIIPEIIKIFPNAKFIFLFRNPVHIFSSIIETWGNGRFHKLYETYIDLSYGPIAISEGFNLLKHKAYALQYENFVQNPEKYIKEICNYLEIKYYSKMLQNFINQDTKGRMGDSTGIKNYKSISAASLTKWKKTFNNPIRKKILLNYVRNIDEYILKIQGYNKSNIIKEIKSIEVKKSLPIQDVLDLLYANLIRIFKPNIWFGKSTKKWARTKYLS